MLKKGQIENGIFSLLEGDPYMIQRKECSKLEGKRQREHKRNTNKIDFKQTTIKSTRMTLEIVKLSEFDIAPHIIFLSLQ